MEHAAEGHAKYQPRMLVKHTRTEDGYTVTYSSTIDVEPTFEELLELGSDD